jgi:hypothetical protein
MEQPPTQWAITFTATGTVGKGTGPDPESLNKENAE